MAANINDFLRFLKANYPDDWRRATVDKVPDDVLEAILSKHKGHYEVWKRIPEWIKSKYGDILPPHVLNGNETVKDFVKNEELKKEKEDKVATEIVMLPIGLSATAALSIQGNAALRMKLAEWARNGTLTPEQRDLWLASRMDDRDVIIQDWQKNQPEKYLMHVVKEINRYYKRIERNATGEELAKAKKSLAQDMNEQLSPLLAFMQSKEGRKKMAEYLKQTPQQAALKQLSPEILDQFKAVMRDNGIGVKSGRTSLADELKAAFNDKEKAIATLYKNKQSFIPRTHSVNSIKWRNTHEEALLRLLREKKMSKRVA